MSGRVLGLAGLAVAVITVAGLAAYLGVAGLSGASELASVISGFVGLAGVGVAVYGVVQAHKDAVASPSGGRAGGQSVTDTTARTVTQVRGVTGNVSVGGFSPAASPAGPAPSVVSGSRVLPPAAPGAASGGGQTVA